MKNFLFLLLHLFIFSLGFVFLIDVLYFIFQQTLLPLPRLVYALPYICILLFLIVLAITKFPKFK